MAKEMIMTYFCFWQNLKDCGTWLSQVTAFNDFIALSGCMLKTCASGGMCVVSFTINKEGFIEDSSIKLLKDIGGGCGEEAVRVVKSMNEGLGNWIPSQERGKAIDFKFNLPIRFKLH